MPNAGASEGPPVRGTAEELRQRAGHDAERVRLRDDGDGLLDTVSRQPWEDRLLSLEQHVFDLHDRRLRHVELQNKLLTQQLENVRGDKGELGTKARRYGMSAYSSPEESPSGPAASTAAMPVPSAPRMLASTETFTIATPPRPTDIEHMLRTLHDEVTAYTNEMNRQMDSLRGDTTAHARGLAQLQALASQLQGVP